MNALLFHVAVTAAVFVWHGPIWALVCFLFVTVVRLALRTQALLLDNAELHRRLSSEQQPFAMEALDQIVAAIDPDGATDDEPPPASETRPSRNVREIELRRAVDPRSKRA